MKGSTATTAEAKQAAAAWSDAVLECRTLGHSWHQDYEHPENGTKEGRNYLVFFYCTRECGVTRVQRWTPRGLIAKTTLHYPRTEDGHQTYLSEVGAFDRDAKGALRLLTLVGAR